MNAVVEVGKAAGNYDECQESESIIEIDENGDIYRGEVISVLYRDPLGDY